MLLFNESDLIFYSDMIKMIQYEEKVYTDIVLFLHFYVYFIKTIDGTRGIDKKNSQFLLNVYFNTPIFFSKVICFTQLAFFHKLNSIVKRVSSVVVFFSVFCGYEKTAENEIANYSFFLDYSLIAMIVVSTGFRRVVFSNVVIMLLHSLYAEVITNLLVI